MARQSESSDNLSLLDTLEDHQSYIVKLLRQGRHTVFIYSADLNALLFEQAEVIENLSRIARNGATSDIRIIIEDPQMLVDSNTKLLNLARRLPSKIKIQKLTIDPPDNTAFMLVDDDKIWLLHDHQIIAGENTGFANFDAKPEVKNTRGIFKDLWRYSEEDVRLRQLSL